MEIIGSVGKNVDKCRYSDDMLLDCILFAAKNVLGSNPCLGK